MNLLQEHADHELLRQAEDIARLARARIAPQREELLLPRPGRIVRDVAVPGGGQLNDLDAVLCERYAKAVGMAFNPTKPVVPIEAFFSRTITAPSNGGSLVGTQTDPLVAYMRARSIIGAFGATFVTGLRPNADLPIVSAGATVTWHSSETAAPTATDLEFSQLSLTPKHASASISVSRMLAIQSQVEAIAESDLRAAPSPLPRVVRFVQRDAPARSWLNLRGQ